MKLLFIQEAVYVEYNGGLYSSRINYETYWKRFLQHFDGVTVVARAKKVQALPAGYFKSTGDNIADDVFSVVGAISWRPVPQTVLRLNYRYNWQKDLLGNPPSKLAGFQFGLSTYF